jgi:hypothetical protein
MWNSSSRRRRGRRAIRGAAKPRRIPAARGHRSRRVPPPPAGRREIPDPFQSIYDAVFITDRRVRFVSANGAPSFLASTRAETVQAQRARVLCRGRTGAVGHDLGSGKTTGSSDPGPVPRADENLVPAEISVSGCPWAERCTELLRARHHPAQEAESA